mmetsp:Transcript_55301/g.155617  ORF Transcript_55301/g.155617 Transcript_55301/m.155617 type:complete len:285 (+) Transcript_55301:1067-1921(+)
MVQDDHEEDELEDVQRREHVLGVDGAEYLAEEALHLDDADHPHETQEPQSSANLKVTEALCIVHCVGHVDREQRPVARHEDHVGDEPGPYVVGGDLPEADFGGAVYVVPHAEGLGHVDGPIARDNHSHQYPVLVGDQGRDLQGQHEEVVQDEERADGFPQEPVRGHRRRGGFLPLDVPEAAHDRAPPHHRRLVAGLHRVGHLRRQGAGGIVGLYLDPQGQELVRGGAGVAAPARVLLAGGLELVQGHAAHLQGCWRQVVVAGLRVGGLGDEAGGLLRALRRGLP